MNSTCPNLTCHINFKNFLSFRIFFISIIEPLYLINQYILSLVIGILKFYDFFIIYNVIRI